MDRNVFLKVIDGGAGKQKKQEKVQTEQDPPPVPKPAKQYIVFAYAWTKREVQPSHSMHENGWHDGYSLHLSSADISEFMNAYTEPCAPGTYIELAKSGGLGYSPLMVVVVNEETFNKIRASKAGIKGSFAFEKLDTCCEFTPTNATYQGK